MLVDLTRGPAEVDPALEHVEPVDESALGLGLAGTDSRHDLTIIGPHQIGGATPCGRCTTE